MKLYVSADIAGAHINPVETHQNYIWAGGFLLEYEATSINNCTRCFAGELVSRSKIRENLIGKVTKFIYRSTLRTHGKS